MKGELGPRRGDGVVGRRGPSLLSGASLALFVVVVTATALITVWVGIPVLVVTLGLVRRLAQYRRREIARLRGEPVESPYLRAPEGGLLVRVRALPADPAVRRDVVWLLVDGTAGLALAIIAVVENILDLILWWLPTVDRVRTPTPPSTAPCSASRRRAGWRCACSS